MWYLIITKSWRTGLKCTQVPAYMGLVLFYWMLHVTPRPPYGIYHWNFKKAWYDLFSLYQFSIWFEKKWCMWNLFMFGSWSDCCLHLGPWQAIWSYLFSNMPYLAVQQLCLFEVWERWPFCVFSSSIYSSDFVSTFPILFLYFCSGNYYIPVYLTPLVAFSQDYSISIFISDVRRATANNPFDNPSFE